MSTALRLTASELRALSSASAPLGALTPARDKVADFLHTARHTGDFVLAPARCTCPQGFGQRRDQNCPIHGSTT
jgi:hypothetical protein